jgi:hypothetical protein
VTTPAKGKRRLLLIPADGRHRSVSGAVAWLEWAGHDDVRAIAVELARGHYLRAVAKRDRRVLQQLTKIGLDDASLEAWAARWPFALPAWTLDWARETIRLAGGRYWCPPNDRGGGALIATPAPVTRPLRPRQIAEAAPLLHAEAFLWLARYQIGGAGASYLEIAKRAGSTASNVRRDCARLARLIDVPLRPARRGQPRKKIRPAPIE